MRGTRPAFLSPSTDEHAWDGTWTNLATNPPIHHHGRLWFYYSGRTSGHAAQYPMNFAAIGLSFLRVDGFASLHCAHREGRVVTKPMRWPANAEPRINSDPRRDLSSHPGFRQGEVRVEVAMSRAT